VSLLRRTAAEMIVVAQKRDVQSHLAGNAVVAAKVRRPAAKQS